MTNLIEKEKDKERVWIELLCQKKSYWCFKVLKVLVNSNQCFSRASIYRKACKKDLMLVGKRVFDDFISNALADGLLVQGRRVSIDCGYAIPLQVTDFGLKVFRRAEQWHDFLFDASGKMVLDWRENQ